MEKDYAAQYLCEVQRILTQVAQTQNAAIHTAATWLTDAALAGHRLWAVGCGHAGLLAQELFYRSGGLVVLNPLFAPGLQLNVSPVTLTSDIERMEGYGRTLIARKQIGDGDVLIVHSVSGRNPVGIDMALAARERGAKVIALTNPGLDLAVDDPWIIPALPAPLAAFAALPALQLFSYEMADYLGKDVDQPRNLAKSVTVE